MLRASLDISFCIDCSYCFDDGKAEAEILFDDDDDDDDDDDVVIEFVRHFVTTPSSDNRKHINSSTRNK